MKKIYFVAFVILLFASCTTSKKLQDFSNNKLIFGSGGGITGATNEYVLHFDGLIEKTNSLTEETTEVTKVPKKQSKQYFQQFLNSGLDTLNYSVPGNMSYFVGFKNDSLSKKITWGGNGSPPVKAKEIYTSLIQEINNQ